MTRPTLTLPVSSERLMAIVDDLTTQADGTEYGASNGEESEALRAMVKEMHGDQD
jgi:hypothetical protein